MMTYFFLNTKGLIKKCLCIDRSVLSHLSALGRHSLVRALLYKMQQLRLQVSVQGIERGQVRRGQRAALLGRPFDAVVHVAGNLWNKWDVK